MINIKVDKDYVHTLIAEGATIEILAELSSATLLILEGLKGDTNKLKRIYALSLLSELED